MVVYNELVALTAGAGLLGFAWFVAQLSKNKPIESEGWAGFFGVTGLLLLVTGLHTTVTWPFGGGGFEYANIAFGQPAAGFGALLLFAAVYLWRHRAAFATDARTATVAALSALKPASVFVGALGLAMVVLAITFVRFQLGAAPPEEPISGRFGHLPVIEALFLGGLWGIIALGALLFAISLLTERPTLLRWAVRAWVVGGVVLLLFGAMNYYTHIGMYYNIEHGTQHRW
ncbi:DUF981 family protein [Nocardioides halotolerans]|jgi:uncharacterized membrane protein|uniref:DUF981 family protein n=1 Tax=Nocardioides halotolerans TaxID=433660 RepID=UPI000413718C|nr:DUF981 family protein [Nocardioides halotolerans]